MRSFCADVITPCGVLLRICPSATNLVPVFAIVTRGASVPYQDVIATRVAHVPVVVLFVWVWCWCPPSPCGGRWDCAHIRWWCCCWWPISTSSPSSTSASASSSACSREAASPSPTICRGRCRLVNGCWDCSIWGGWCGCIAGWCIDRGVGGWYVCGGWLCWYVCPCWCGRGGCTYGLYCEHCKLLLCFNKASRSSLVFADNAETLSLVAWAEVLFASCTCCIWAINPSLIDDQLLPLAPVALLTPWYPMVPAVPAPECMRRSYDSVNCILNYGHVWFMTSTAFHSKIAVA